MQSLEELRRNFNQSLEQVLQESHDQILEQYRGANIERLYYFIKFSLPRDLGEWLKREMNCYNSQISNFPPQVIHPELGVNNVFHQGFGAFGLKGGLVYLGLSYFPFQQIWFRIVQWIVALGVGLYYGVTTYKKYDIQYRKELLEVGEKFLTENKKCFQEWFDQMIHFSKEEREICRR